MCFCGLDSAAGVCVCVCMLVCFVLEVNVTRNTAGYLQRWCGSTPRGSGNSAKAFSAAETFLHLQRNADGLRRYWSGKPGVIEHLLMIDW